MRNYGIYFEIMLTLAFLLGGGMYMIYGFLPHEYFVPTSLAISVVAFAVVYVILTRVVEL